MFSLPRIYVNGSRSLILRLTINNEMVWRLFPIRYYLDIEICSANISVDRIIVLYELASNVKLSTLPILDFLNILYGRRSEILTISIQDKFSFFKQLPTRFVYSHALSPRSAEVFNSRKYLLFISVIYVTP